MAPETLRRFGISALPVLFLMLMVLVSLHFMSSAIQNAEQLNRLFTPLLLASILGLFMLVIVVGVNIARLISRYRRQAAGSRLTLRMVVLFVALSLTPVVVVFYYSQQFLLQGIDSWFDVQIDQAMEDALGLSRASLALHKRERLKTTRRLLSELRGISSAGLSLSLEDLRDKYDVTELVMLTRSGTVVANVNADPSVLVPSETAPEILQQVIGGEDFIGLTLKGRDQIMEVQVVIKDPIRGLFLKALYTTSAKITRLTETVQNAYSRYKELSYLRQSLKQTFTLTLSLVLLFSLLGAVWAAFFAARRLVAPIADIAEGTRAVAEGEYDKQLPLPTSHDELGFLVASFNAMTRRIAQARDETAATQRQLEAQRSYLETVLSRLSSGVVVFDAGANIRTLNQAALAILGLDPAAAPERDLEQLAADSPHLVPLFEVLRPVLQRQQPDWREQVTLSSSEGRQILLCRGTPLAGPEGDVSGYVLVFDDITTLAQAQRDAAWGEVARRLAHEIKNPLTPIQLSAERLRRRYLGRMAPEDAELLDRSTRTIVQQVEAMKEMVNAFSDYARPSRITRTPLVFDQLVSEVLDLYRSGGLGITLEQDLQADDCRLEGDPVRLRQVVHNLVKNGQEALAGRADGWLGVSSRCVEMNDCRYVELRVMDNGPGFDPGTLDHLFEPYVTTKSKGTGLGLAIVKKIIEEHGGRIWAQNRTGGGAELILRLPANEREALCRDQPAARGEEL